MLPKDLVYVGAPSDKTEEARERRGGRFHRVNLINQISKIM
jgi:hypothetical protein